MQCMTQRNIVILISGGGSNMAAIVKTAQRDNWQQRYGARVAAVISNKADAGGLQFARVQARIVRPARRRGVGAGGDGRHVVRY